LRYPWLPIYVSWRVWGGTGGIWVGLIGQGGDTEIALSPPHALIALAPCLWAHGNSIASVLWLQNERKGGCILGSLPTSLFNMSSCRRWLPTRVGKKVGGWDLSGSRPREFFRKKFRLCNLHLNHPNTTAGSNPFPTSCVNYVRSTPIPESFVASWLFRKSALAQILIQIAEAVS
jgi:hypothetical protein